MSNYFEYQDFAKVDRADIALSANADLQTGSDIEQLRNGIEPYRYASLEKDVYNTAKPKVLATNTDKFGFLTNTVSDENGNANLTIVVDLVASFTLPGITLGCINKLADVTITYSDTNNDTIREENFTSDYIKDTLQFFNMASEGVRFVKITVNKTEKPNVFVGIYRIDLGSVRVFNDTNLIEAEVNSHYSVDGSTIEYDVLKASVFYEDDTEYMFTKRQPIVYKDENGKVLHKFYVEKGESGTDNTISLTAYDSISLLESKFLGGIYGFEDATSYPFNQLLADIFSGTGVEYRTEGTNDISVTGYIPICTRRKALALICKGTNVRCVKQGGVLVFKPVSSGNNVDYDDTVIVENPTVKTSQKVGRLTMLEHNYKRSNEEVELFNWYLKQGENTMQLIEFSEPVWKINAYEVTGFDEVTKLDIVSNRDLREELTYYHAPIGDGQEPGDENACNYCIIKNNTLANKIIIKGWKISDNTDDYVVSRNSFDVNADYDEIVVEDVTITSGIADVGKFLFANANQKTEQDFEVVEVDRPQVGDNINTSLVNSPVVIESDKGNINYNIKITAVTDNLSGVYRVVAE
jgi:hypothetical protein